MEDLAVGILLSVLAVIAFKCNMDSRERFDRNCKVACHSDQYIVDSDFVGAIKDCFCSGSDGEFVKKELPK